MKTIKQIITVVAVAMFMLSSFNSNAQTSFNYESKLLNIYKFQTTDLSINGNINYINDLKQVKKRKWWQTAIIDAAGALGGAAAVGQFINVGAITPGGWLALAGGAILGGAGASIAANKSSGGTGIPTTKEDYLKLMLKAKNKNCLNDEIGQGHNQLILDYFKDNKNYNSDDFYNFAVTKGKNNKFNKKSFNKIVLNNKLINGSIDDVFNNIFPNLPKSINQNKFKSILLSILDTSNKETVLDKLISFEENIKSENKLNKFETFKIEAFFSTFRHSVILW
jgi:hypothetical protein